MTTDHNLSRFFKAQNGVYGTALKEIKNGKKTSHWMWFIFPQISGLGLSEMAKFYAIKDQNEAEAYLNHPVLGTRLIEISSELLKLETHNSEVIFGHIDSLKLKSSMTLFSLLINANPVFRKVLNQFFNGRSDEKTIQLLH